MSGAIVTYTPNANYFGADSFTFQANNGSASNTAKVSHYRDAASAGRRTSANGVDALSTPATVNFGALPVNGAGTITYQIVAESCERKLAAQHRR